MFLGDLGCNVFPPKSRFWGMTGNALGCAATEVEAPLFSVIFCRNRINPCLSWSRLAQTPLQSRKFSVPALQTTAKAEMRGKSN